MNKHLLGAAAVAALAPLALVPSSSVAGPPSAAPTAPALTEPTLTGWSSLPTATYDPGSEPSGRFATGNATIPSPYAAQPVQGFSGTHRLADGSYLVMSDNGFGAKANSQDFLLAVHHIAPDTATERTSYIRTEFNLSDPAHLVPFPIWRDGGCTAAASLPAGYTCPSDRKLTGWDFDVESMQVAPDGTFWFGDEFGPFLLHANAHGELIDAPIPTPGVTSLSNPYVLAGQAVANQRNSKGFEGMAISPNGEFLHPLLEGATNDDIAAGLASDLHIYTVHNGAFRPGFLRYRMERPTNAIGDFILVNNHQGLVIERDDTQNDPTGFKRIYLVDLRDEDGDGYVSKQLLVDLNDLANPARLGGFGERFHFTYFTIEDVEVIDSDTIAVMNDNNFPAYGGRGAAVTDVNEYLEITLPEALKVDKRLLARG